MSPHDLSASQRINQSTSHNKRKIKEHKEKILFENITI